MPLPAPQPNVRVVTLKIDGQDLSAREDETIIEVCRENKIPIPSLCWMDGLSIVGACRLCMVEIAGSPACWPPAPPGSPRAWSADQHREAAALPPHHGRAAVRRAQSRLLGLRLQRPLRAAMAGQHLRRRPCAHALPQRRLRGRQQPRDVPRRPQPLRALHPLRARLRRDRGRPHLGRHGPRQRLPGHHRPGPSPGATATPAPAAASACRSAPPAPWSSRALPSARWSKTNTSCPFWPDGDTSDEHHQPSAAVRR
jgi:ferredoxin